MKISIALIMVALAAPPCLAQQPPSPEQLLLGSISRMRIAIEQEQDRDADKAKTGSGAAPVVVGPGATLGEMRARMSDNLQSIREPFRCLDVDIEKNSGPVVLVCGNNSGSSAAVQSNNVNSGNKFYGAPVGLRP
jgi:hypothetical protein